MVRTACCKVEEFHLLIPIIWEGDLRLHSDVMHMKDSVFKQNIIHGDTTVTLTIQLMNEKLLQPLNVIAMKNKMLKAVYVGDELYVEFQHDAPHIHYITRNQKDEEVLEGELTYAYEKI